MHYQGLLRLFGHRMEVARLKARISRRELAVKLDVSEAKISRCLTGRVRMAWSDFEAFVRAVAPEHDEKVALEQLWNQLRSMRAALDDFADVLPSRRREYYEAIQVADRVEIFATTTVPELLRTPNYHYSSGLLETMPVSRWVELFRSLVTVKNPDRNVHVILDEAVLWRRVIGFDDQMRALQMAAAQPGCQVQVLSFEAGPIAIYPFTILTWQHEGTQMVASPLAGDIRFADEGGVLGRYSARQVWDLLTAQASDPEDLPAIIERALLDPEERPRGSLVPLRGH